MPSQAASGFAVDLAKARHLLLLASERRLKPIARDKAQAYLHASLTAYVAAWDAYAKALVKEFFGVVANPRQPAYLAIHTVALKSADLALEKFNTPNWENTRRLLVTQTGYDPIADWSWRHMNVQSVQLKMNEIVKVRHSFAHGFPLPSLAWTTSPHGRVALTVSAVRGVEAFFRNLVRKTDRGMAHFIALQYGIRRPW